MTASTHQGPTDETPIADLWKRKLNEIFETRNMKLSEVDEALRCLDEVHPSMEIYRNYFYLLAHLEFEEADAARH